MGVRTENVTAGLSLRDSDGAPGQQSFFARPFVTDFTFRLRYLGFGLYWAWMTTFWTGIVRSPLGMASAELTTTARISVQAATAVTFIVAALLARRLTNSFGERLLVLGGAVLGPLGTVAAALGRGQTDGIPMYLALSWVCLGVSCACITLLWGRFYAAIGLRHAALLAPLSLILAVFAGLLLANMQPTAALVIITLLPLGSVGLYVLTAPQLPVLRAPEKGSRPRPLNELWRVFLAIGVYSAALGFYLHSQTVFPQSSPSSATSRLVSLLIPLLVIALLRQHNFGLVFRVGLPLTAAGFLLLPLLGTNSSWIGAAVIAAGGTLVDILTWIALADIAHRSRFSPISVFGFGRAANAGGIALGWAISSALLGTTLTEPSPVLGFSLTMVFVLILTTTLILKDEDFATDDIRPGLGMFAGDHIGGDHRGESEDGHHGPGRWRRSCARIAHEHNLSPREEEVLVLLAKGRSVKHIEKTLVISYHTAKAHANHIYRKLEVHSREELIDLVEQNKELEPLVDDEPDGWAGADHEKTATAI